MNAKKHTRNTLALSYILQKMNTISLSIMVRLMLSTKRLYNVMIDTFLLRLQENTAIILLIILLAISYLINLLTLKI